MTRKLFGTDGVRGRANVYPMTAEMALKLGAAAGRFFRPRPNFSPMAGDRGCDNTPRGGGRKVRDP